jgi:hypothetical protein
MSPLKVPATSSNVNVYANEPLSVQVPEPDVAVCALEICAFMTPAALFIEPVAFATDRAFANFSVVFMTLCIAGPAGNALAGLNSGAPVPVADKPTLPRLRKVMPEPWAMLDPCVELDAACAPCVPVLIEVTPPPLLAPPPPPPPQFTRKSETIRTSAATARNPNLILRVVLM